MTDELRTPELSPMKRALLAIERLEAKVRELEGERSQPIAIVGMGCRFPAGNDPVSFWNALRSGVDAVRPRPPFARPGWPATEPDQPFPFAPAGWLDHDIAGFDPGFFGISPRESASIDPQQRLLLEVMWEAFENAGIDPHTLEGTRTGVFIGIVGNDYAQLQLGSERANDLLNSHYAAGIGHSMASGRIAYLLGLHGPAITVDTACSSSLVAVHLACQALRAGEVDAAVVGGTNLILNGDLSQAYQQSRMLSPDGRCKAFSASADGFGRGEGCGVVVLKRLADARRAGDRVLAVIRASVSNQDGPSSGLTAPNGPAQEALIREALRQAGLTPEDIDYIEAHGTGTELGDPIELQALGAVFAGRTRPLPVGSVKANMGHLEAAAGIAGLIKVVLMLQHGEIPPHLHFTAPSPHVPWERLQLEVPTSLAPLATPGPRRAGVSSFGFSGTNVHVIAESGFGGVGAGDGGVGGATAGGAGVVSRRLLAISADGAGGVRELARRYADRLAGLGDSFADICFTASCGRAHFGERLAVVAGDASTAVSALQAWLADGKSPAVRVGRREGPDRPVLAFLYTGQGAQHPGMGWALYNSEPVFRSAFERCDSLLRDHLEIPLLEVLRPDSPHAEFVHRTDYTQPTLFALQYALTELWASWGIRPDVVAGHSIGEFAAACAAGVFSLDDALRVVAARGRLMQAVEAPGRMLAVMAGEEVVADWLAGVDAVSIAALNAPGQVVVSGDTDAVGQIEVMARFAGVDTKPLRTSQAFHSPLMDGVIAPFESVLRTVEFRPPRLRFVSAVTGRPATPAELTDPHYWATQLRVPVRFADAAASVARLADRGLEIGPHPVLAGLVAQGDTPLPVHPSLHRERDASPTILSTLAELYVHGVDPDWRGFHDGRHRRVDLPLYPFERMRLWVDLGAGRRDDLSGAHPLLGPVRRRPGGVLEFERTLRADAPAFIGEHVVRGRAILPGTAFVEMILAAGKTALGGRVEVRGLDLIAPMPFDGGARRVLVAVDGDGRVTVHSVDAAAPDTWVLHATATVVGEHRGAGVGAGAEVGAGEHWGAGVGAGAGLQVGTAANGAGTPGLVRNTGRREDLAAVRGRCTTAIDAGEFYASLVARGYGFGPRLRGISELWAGDGEALARVAVPDACADDPDGYIAHPLLLDAALQAVAPALGDSHRTWVPAAIERVVVSGTIGLRGWAYARVTSPGPHSNGTRNITAEVRLFDEEGGELARLDGVTFHELSANSPESTDPLYEVRWVPDPNAGLTSADRAVLREQARSTLGEQAEREGAQQYDVFVAALEARAAQYVVQAFQLLGWDPAVGDAVVVDMLATTLGVVPGRRRLLTRALDILAEEGVLRPGADGWTVTRMLDDALPAGTRDDGTAAAGTDTDSAAVARVSGNAAEPGDIAPELVLLDRCGPHLADTLRGLGDPLELLFPGGDMSVAERLYHDSPTARMFNRAVASTVKTALETGASDRPLRVLEVGGGTGGTTIHVVDQLATTDLRRPHLYTFTDISPLFVERARRRFDGVPGIEYRLFDLDQPAEMQGFEPASFDLVIAANCLHAARDLRAALHNVGGLLRPGGMLLAVEVFAPHRWFDLTVGLTDGWWHYTDSDLRDRYPCIPPDSWARVLREAGFDEVAPIRLADVCAADGLASTGQGLLLATRAARLENTDPWLVITDDLGVGDAMAASLRAAGAEVVSIPAAVLDSEGDAGPLLPDSHVTDVLQSAEPQLRALLHERPRWGGILHCGGVARDHSLAPDALAGRLRRGAGTLLAVARLLARGEVEVPRLSVVTRAAQVVGDDAGEVDPAAAAVWGLARTIRLELPELVCTCLDGVEPWLERSWLKKRDDVPSLSTTASAILPEPEVAVRHGVTLVPRLVPRAPEKPLPLDYRLTPPKSGAIDDLALAPGDRQPPAPGQVEIRVAASGVNFKDVLNVLGMYPGDPGPLGSECAGVITTVGAGGELAPGTPVVAVAGHAYGKHVVADAALVAPVPAGLSFAEAATLPVAYLTAHFALNHLGRIGAGDRVLIHAAAGGVGLAACALARRAGAEIFATAGSPQKREFLRSLGIAHVFDSRSSTFAGEILQATGGAGVTIVLNSLADERIAPSFDVLAPAGRFLEIGKRGIWTPGQVAALGRDIDYHVIDWGATGREDPALIGRLFREVIDLVGAGELDPLPMTTFPVERVAEAFRHMATGRHTGKIVVMHPVLATDGPLTFDAEHSYLITGGTSGLGLETAKWAAQRGARTLVLAARSEPGGEALPDIQAMRAEGVTVHIRRCDVGDPNDVAALMTWVAETLPPLGGIVHAAGTLADRTLQHTTWEDFEAVLRAKVYGATHLAAAATHARGFEARPQNTTAATHPSATAAATHADRPFFIAYSSIASVLGSAGQGNHAAANAFLDAFSATRWRDDSVGMSIAWGPWSETGSATDAETLERTRNLGVGAFTTADGLDRLERAFDAPRPLVVAADITDPATLRARRGPLLDQLAGTPAKQPGNAARPATAVSTDTLPALIAATPAGARHGVLLRRVRDRVRVVLGLPENAPLEPTRPLGELGLDSLLAVELRNALGRDAERRLPATLLFDHPTVAALTQHLLDLLAPTVSPDPDPVDSQTGKTNPLAAVESLSDDDVDRLLAAKLVRHE